MVKQVVFKMKGKSVVLDIFKTVFMLSQDW